MNKMMKRVNLFPKKTRAGVAYGISKHFVIWFAKQDAARFGAKGIRVLSVSPGNFETPMGELEKEEADLYTKYCAIKRFGHVNEIASLFAYCASEEAGYLTGVDILCDGGLVASGVNPLKRNEK
jgi:NAD(P)-dependent dehydrogenase (short-subunit alcohol dehydrogenase family)